MARREWAEKEVTKRLSDGWSGDALVMGRNEAMDMLIKQHARAVRIVKRYLNRSTRVYKAADAKASPDFNHYEVHFLIEHVCWEILDALQKGRA